MYELNHWIVFLTAALALNVSPGPDIAYIVSNTVAHGKRHGFAASFGVCSGAIVHVLVAAFGLSAILAASALAFSVVKWVGAAYLIWMGIRTLMAKDPSPEMPLVPAEPLHRAFRDGFVVNLFNPKTAIFFLAFLPQFVDPARSALHWQILILGLTFMGLADIIVYMAFGLILGSAAVATALAFGLGGRDAAARLLDRYSDGGAANAPPPPPRRLRSNPGEPDDSQPPLV